MLKELLRFWGMDIEWQGHYFMTDFESALRQSLITQFPNLVLLGCYFHWSQLIIKRVKNSKMGKYFQQIPVFSSFIRRVCSLPFVPEFCMETAMSILYEHCDSLEGTMLPFGKRLLKYIEIQWLGNFARLQNWNLFNIDCNLIPLTNNGQEAGNSRLNINFPVHPSIYMFLLVVVNHLNILALKLSDIRYGRIKHNAKTIYRELQEEREQAKAVLIEKVNIDNINTKSSKEHLNMYMGKMGITAARLGKSKVESDYTETDLLNEGDDPAWIAASEGIQEGIVSNRHKNYREGLKGKNKAVPGETRLRPKKREVLPFITLFESCIGDLPIDSMQGDRLNHHIKRNGLNLEKFGIVRVQGDCFYDSILNLCHHHGVEIAACNSLELRRAIVNNIEKHANFRLWLGVEWRGRMSLFRQFQNLHRREQTFTDNSGIILYSTMHLLNINISIVSPNPQNIPSTLYMGSDTASVTFLLGYYQV